jgi:putative sterol carrier protein
VVQFLTPEWVERCNGALDGLRADADGSIVAAGGNFVVEQVITGVPPDARTVRTVLRASDGHLRLALEHGTQPGEDANVVMESSYEDAAALARGEIDAASALGEGRVRVHGDLAVLVAAQAVLQAGASSLARVQADTTY